MTTICRNVLGREVLVSPRSSVLGLRWTARIMLRKSDVRLLCVHKSVFGIFKKVWPRVVGRVGRRFDWCGGSRSGCRYSRFENKLLRFGCGVETLLD